MTEEQRSLAGYKSKVHEQGDFDNPNEGKPQLSDSDEYVFFLKAMPKVKPITDTKKGKDGVERKVVSDKAICLFEDETFHNEVVSIFKIDSLNFSDDETYESGVIRFFKKIKQPLPYGKDVEAWSIHFIVGMRFRGRVAIKTKKDKDGNIVTNYYLDIPTCRPILPTDKHPDAVANTAAQNAPKTNTEASELANAKIIIHGCTCSTEAYQRLLDAKVTTPVIQAFLAADKAGQIIYPC